MKVKEENLKVGLKLSIQKSKIMASGPITSWQVDGETMETVRDFILGGTKITADGNCSHEIKRRLLLGRKAMTNLDNVLKSRGITLPTNVHLVKAMVFPVVTYGCESWTIKKGECRRTDAFELVLEKTLESPLNRKKIQPVHPKGNQSWIVIGRTDAEAENPVLWPLDAKNWLIGKDPDAGKDWKRRRRGWPRMRLLNGITDSMDMSLSKLWELVMVGTWHAAVHEVTKSWTRLSNWRTDWLFPQAVTGIVILWKETLKHCYSILNSLKINLVSCLSLYPAPSEPLCIWVSRNWKAFPFFLAIYSSSFPQNKAQESTN